MQFSNEYRLNQYGSNEAAERNMIYEKNNYTNWMSKIFKEITNGRGERVLENPAVQVLGAIFRKMNLDQNTIGAVSERLQNEKEKKDNIVKIIVAVVIIYLICYIIGGEVEWLARTAIIWTGIVLAIRGIRKKN